MAPLSVSVVSHGHGAQLLHVLGLLARQPCRVWLTLNIPEPDVIVSLGQESSQGRFAIGSADIHLIQNPMPLGFGANHNQAFAHDQALPDPAPFFAVLNPDLHWEGNPWPTMLALAGQKRVGCVYPMQQDVRGREQDHRRTLPTPRALWRRYTSSERLQQPLPSAPDWVNAAMLLFPAEVYRALHGFDERYHMYCEDVDLCIRLQLAGYRLAQAHSVRVTHEAHRASHRHWRHLAWHVRSLLILWRSVPYARYRRLRQLGELPVPEQ